MTPPFTIILPHKRNPGNDRALAVALDCLMTNTVNDFILLMNAADNKPLYPRVNAMMEQATTDCCVYWSSDMFAAPAWDVPMLALWNEQTIVTNMLVEPGAIGMHPENIHKDFGRKPDTFRRAEFEAYAQSETAHYDPGHRGWYCPYLISRCAFLSRGGFVTDLDGDMHGFTGADQLFFEQWLADGRQIVRARSYTYHLQRWSEEEEQLHGKRDIRS